jgi:hypothetical protein
MKSLKFRSNSWEAKDDPSFQRRWYALQDLEVREF